VSYPPPTPAIARLRPPTRCPTGSRGSRSASSPARSPSSSCPGRDPSGCIVTALLGIVGAFVGGLIGSALGWGQVAGNRSTPLVGLATLGAILLLLLGRLARRVR
jgi:uncharacterized membrane protein YeaQ/YmgE (transglycosylase-associated protein family)